MVLQEHASYDQRPFIYGFAEASGELVTVVRQRPNGQKDTYYASADSQKAWIVELDPDYFPASQNNLTIFISGSVPPLNTIVIREAVYGDVFLCGGQSNMNENVAACFDANETMASSFPNLRLFSMAEAGATTPQSDIPAFVSVDSTPCSFPQFRVPNTEQRCNTWQSATRPSVIGSFSAACLYTALSLQKTITDGRFIGLIHASVSGTGMKLWATQQAISKCDAQAGAGSPEAQAVAYPLDVAIPPGNSTLWNAMIHPISRYAIRAVIWDQGESDSGEPPAYFSCLFQSLVESWRRVWRIGDFAWVFAQLGAQDSGSWPTYYINSARAAQASALPGRNGSTTDTIGMAVAFDLGDMHSPYPPYHVHARNKSEVGRRLALALLHTQYALQYPSSPGLINLTHTLDWAPPRLASAKALSASTIALSFTLDAGAVLLARDTPDCWECCTAGRDTFQVATSQASTAWVNCTMALGEDGTSVTLTPTASGEGTWAYVRFAPNLWPQCVLLGSTNLLPPEPFTAPIDAQAVAQAVALPGGAAGALRPREAPPTPTPSAWGPEGWKGRPVEVPTDCQIACTPPMGYNTVSSSPSPSSQPRLAWRL
jgi:hypothetical protein